MYDHWLCRDILTYLHVARGEETRENLLRIINKPLRYVSRSAFSGKGVTLDALEAMYEEKEWMARRIRDLRSDLRSIRKCTPYMAVQYIRKTVDYDSYLKEYAGQHDLKAEELFEIADELLLDAQEYRTFEEWSAHMQNFREELARQKETGAAKGEGVILATMHGTKGLEYPIVFLPDVNEKTIPHEKAGVMADVEEERRLFYVAMTRAKEKLHIYSVNSRHGKTTVVSRFAEELKAPRKIQEERHTFRPHGKKEPLRGETSAAAREPGRS